ncbi:villin-like protein quail isoform X2 [Teleopsis dalmanni]|uniref:villin-like protein quail isoform X2 n=1 Tax=Teleopsis dalmanni TaxID=139649 RepID=UPI0018CE8D1B|nr:villin-like protein quail isoform X2 [Teleopsis dalmanni]
MGAINLDTFDVELVSDSISESKVDASFRRVSKHLQCFQIWKIAEDSLEILPTTEYGNFYDNYGYIIYNAAQPGVFPNEDTIPREVRQGVILNRFLHFWFGTKASDQTRANLTHKINELDKYFGHTCTIYRDCQESESARFMSYFRKGLTIRSSEIAGTSASQHLFRVEGRRWLRCTQMPDINWEHFASDYCMVLVTENCVYVWLGRFSSTVERRNSLNWASKLAKPETEVIVLEDGYEQALPENHKQQWNSILPLHDRFVSQGTAADSEKHLLKKIKIFKCCYKKSRLHLDEVNSIEPNKKDLEDIESSYILDAGGRGVWLWVGRNALQNTQINCIRIARSYANKKNYPYGTQVVRVVDGYEPSEFIRLFPNAQTEWNSSNITRRPLSAGYGRVENNILVQRPKMAADMQLIDDGCGARKIYRVYEKLIQEQPDNALPMFCSKNCYVICYSVRLNASNPTDAQNVGVKHVVYNWIGSEASHNVKKMAEKYAKKCFEESSSKCILVQIHEFCETPHFLQMFGGKFIIIANERQINYTADGLDLGNILFVFKCYGNATYNTRTMETFPMTSLTPTHCYVVKSDQIYVWCGTHTTGDEREMAKNIGAMFGQYSLVIQGREPPNFWKLNEHLTSPISSDVSFAYKNTNDNMVRSVMVPQLLTIWSQRNQIRTFEIIGYDQSDLIPECTYILDTGSVCFIWLGEHASNCKKQTELHFVSYYIKHIHIPRKPSTAIIVVKQNSEPNIFTGHFENWNIDHWKDYVSYENLRNTFNINVVKTQNGSSSESIPSFYEAHREFDQHAKFPLKVLQQEVSALPDVVSPLKREEHLTHDDFVRTFNMTFPEYDQLPTWKKQELKKKHKLF